MHFAIKLREHFLNRAIPLRDSTCTLETEPGKPVISNKDYCEPDILFIN